MKSGNPNFLETSGPLQACNGTALPFFTDGGIWARLLSEPLPQLTTQVIEDKACDTAGRLKNTTVQTLLLT